MTLLSTELAGDPQAIGYVGKSDAQAADLLNLKTRSYLPDRITGAQLLEIIDLAEFAGLAVQEKDFVRMAVSAGGELDVSPGSRTLAQLKAIFPVGGATRANMAATFKRSRADELGLGFISRRDVAIARRK